MVESGARCAAANTKLRRSRSEASARGFVVEKMVRPEGFEPPTNGFGSHYSIRLSYGRLMQPPVSYRAARHSSGKSIGALGDGMRMAATSRCVHSLALRAQSATMPLRRLPRSRPPGCPR